MPERSKWTKSPQKRRKVLLFIKKADTIIIGRASLRRIKIFNEKKADIVEQETNHLRISFSGF